MIFSEQWIREWVNPALSTDALVEQLTMAGLEVDAVNDVASEFSGVIIAEVLKVIPHPDADKLRVCEVSDGTSVLQVVCGAPNVREGLKVPYAQVGANLTGADGKSFKIRQAKLRGIESNGMLCSAEELGLAESADGLLELAADAPVSTDIREYLKLNDKSIELDLTPNRGDCLGIIGVAREIAALNALQSNEPEVLAVPAEHDTSFPVQISAVEQCPRYLGRVIKGVNVAAQTPLWMSERLRRSGIRSIDPVVDVTNYVLLELGQPMHAFDLAHLKQGIEVRLAKQDETLTLLDGKQVTLTPDVLVIADQSGPLALAGIMGGEHSGVNEQTQDIFLECAFFSQLAVAGRARRYGLHTDASHRYERGVDFTIQGKAMERATALLIEIAGGSPGPVVETLGKVPSSPEISLSFAKLSKFLGLSIPVGEVQEILTRLGAHVLSVDDMAITIKAPSYRFDFALDVDLIEEIARVYGYNKLPKTKSLSRNSLGTRTETRAELPRLKDRLVSLGYQEVITYSFVEPGLLELLNPGVAATALQNPISAEMSVMRTSLWPGLLSTLQYNANRQQDRVRLFETGQVFVQRDGALAQPSMMSGLVFGHLQEALWSNVKKPVDFFDIKGDIESLLGLTRNAARFSFTKAEHPALHSGQSAALLLDGQQVGLIGALHPSIQRKLDISNKVYLFEIDINSLLESKVPKIQELSKFPEVSRDLAIVIDQEVSAQQILDCVRASAGDSLVNLRIFDVYQGDAVEKSKKSIALGLTLQHTSRTLGDEDINGIINSCVNELQTQFNAKLRN